MPRPGPRPYECVRRAWHSDRHHPIRGSLIQEIFRVVNEIHSPATRKNKEWQEKLPIVVLKAEEIMYSKANSEAEYMDIKTLWDRANDAINTIIRRDETTETGELLQPCIEAALNLGCTPRRASRSQRNSNPRCYLSPNNQGPTSNPLSSLDNTTHGIHATNSEYSSHYSNLVKKSTTAKLTHFGTEPLCHIVAQHNNCTNSKFPFSFPPSTNNHCLPLETCPASKACMVYPLFYGNNLNCNKSQFDSGIPFKLNSDTMEPAAEISIMQNQFSYNLDASNKTIQAEFSDTPQNQQPEIEFDLSLRLGPLSVPCTSIENNLPREVEDVSSISTSREGSKSGDPSPQMKNGFSFFLRGNADDPLDLCSSKRNPTDSTIRKRKAIVCPPIEEKQFCSQAKAFI